VIGAVTLLSLFGYSSCTSRSIQYSEGITVYVCALDVTKAFDCEDHAISIKRLIRRGVLPYFLGVTNNWYNKISPVVRWNLVLSDETNCFMCVRKGGVLSRVLFNL